jgi:alpha-tubulin suppressor-like RCC1 family protein
VVVVSFLLGSACHRLADTGPSTLEETSLAIAGLPDTITNGDTISIEARLLDSRGRRITRTGMSWRFDPESAVVVISKGENTVNAQFVRLGGVRVTVSAVGAAFDSAHSEQDLYVAEKWLDVAAGVGHTCATASSGTYCWGDGQRGALGSGSSLQALTPQPVAGAPVLEKIVAGAWHTCGMLRVVTSAAQVVCWGSDEDRQTSSGNAAAVESRPAPVTLSSRARTLEAGGSQSCALLADSLRVVCWGIGAFARTTSLPTPVLDLVVGGGFVCTISTLERASCWGDNRSGVIGKGRGVVADAPALVASSLLFATLAAGESHLCGTTPAGDAYCWGSGHSGQLGTSSAFEACASGPCSYAPVPVAGGLRFVAVATGRAFTCGLDATGRAYCWGSNQRGQLGSTSADSCDTGACSRFPQPVLTTRRFLKLSAGAEHVCGIDVRARLYCWGANATGQLGNGGTIDRPAPTAVAQPSQARSR